MSIEEENKAVMRRWYDEMYNQRHLALMPELAGPEYIRHEPTGTWTATIAALMERANKAFDDGVTTQGRRTYALIAEADKVAVLGTARSLDGELEYHFVQVFRLAHGKLVETWFPGYVRGVDWGEMPPTGNSTKNVWRDPLSLEDREQSGDKAVVGRDVCGTSFRRVHATAGRSRVYSPRTDGNVDGDHCRAPRAREATLRRGKTCCEA